MKKWWVFSIAEALAIIMLTLNALAMQTVIEVNSASTLRTALKTVVGEGTIILKADIDANQELVINDRSNVTLDLNGRTLNIKRSAMQVEGSLTIVDSVGGGVLNSSDIAVEVLDDGEFTLESGSVTSEANTAIELAYKSDAKFNMAGGSISARSEAVIVRSGSVNISGGRIDTKAGGVAIEAIYTNSPISVTVGEENGEHSDIYLSGVSVNEGCSLNIYSGIVGDIENVGQDAVLNCLFEQDVSSSLASGWICEPTEYAGTLYYSVKALDVTTAAAKIGTVYYAEAEKAARELDDNETLVLLQDVEGDAPGRALLEINASNPTVDLNGCDVTNTGAGGAGIHITTGSTAQILNSGGEALISAQVPLRLTGAFTDKAMMAEISGQISLETSGCVALELDNALLAYSRDAADAIANGGFAAITDSGEFIFPSAEEAIANSPDGSVKLLNDYFGSEQIAILSGKAKIDLAGHSYTVNGKDAVLTSGSGTSLTVENGELTGNTTVELGASLTLSGIELRGEICASGAGTVLELTGCNVENQGAGVVFNTQGGSLNMDGCNISADPALRVAGGVARIFGGCVLSAAGNSAAISAEGGTVVINDGLFVSESGTALCVSSGTAEVHGGSFSSPVPVENLAWNIKTLSCSSDGMYSYYPDVSSAELAEPEGVVSDISCATGGMCSVAFSGDSLSGLPASIEVPIGALVKLPEAEREDWFFDGWDDGECVYDAGEFVLATADISLTAVWSETDPNIFKVTVAVAEYGSVTTDVESARSGDTVTVTADPDPGYVLDRITVDDVDLDGTSFEMPEHDVEVSAIFISERLTFDDVRPRDWYYDSIVYVCSNGLMDGVSDTEFAPNGTMTRAMFWTVLARIDGVNTDGGETWYSRAREWAMKSGVSDGTSPGELITREQLATMLWRYAGEREVDTSLALYEDAESVSSWAHEALAWAVANGIIEGMTETTLAPHGNATRAQAAAVFMRYIEMLQK